jgi:stage II sporulation protein D
VQEILGLNSTFFEVEVNRPVPNSIEIPIENPYGIEIGRKEVPIKVSERSISFKDILKDLHFVSGEKGEMVTFKGRGQGSGLGLSQWGAEAMAEKHGDGKNYYKTILSHYFTGTKIEKIY